MYIVAVISVDFGYFWLIPVQFFSFSYFRLIQLFTSFIFEKSQTEQKTRTFFKTLPKS